MTADAARQLARRKGWSRTRPNRIGEPAVVSVPADELSSSRLSVDHPTTDDKPTDDRQATDGQPRVTNGKAPTVTDSEQPADARRSDLSVAVDTLHAAVELLGQQLQGERQRADRAEERAVRAESRADELRLALERACGEAAKAVQAVEELERAKAAWEAKTTWQRLRAAWKRG